MCIKSENGVQTVGKYNKKYKSDDSYSRGVPIWRLIRIARRHGGRGHTKTIRLYTDVCSDIIIYS